MTEREAVYVLCRMESIGPAAYERLLQWYGSAADALKENTVPLGKKQCEEWAEIRREEHLKRIRREMEELPAKGIRFLIREDPDFPKTLREIKRPPLGLFLKGRLPEEGADLAAMVGARRCSEYGKTTALEMGKRLGQEGVGVVSGMAMGIDSWSQWGALEGGGYSAAVLGSGIDVCYPPSGRRLYERLVSEGGILSEYGPGERGLPGHFPQRNRLISGLAGVLLVLEAREKSGSLITVDCALEQGREVLALPGRIGDPLSQGCNQLIRQGAGILTGVSDVLAALGREDWKEEAAERAQADPLGGLTETQRRIYGQIGQEPVHLEEISRGAGIGLTELFSVLWELENRNLIRQCSAGSYIRYAAFQGGEK